MITDIADKIANAMAAMPVDGRAFVAERVNHPVIDRKRLDGMCVQVVPRRRTSERGDRARFDRLYVVDIGISAAVRSPSNSETDPLVAFAESVADYWERNNELAVPTATGTAFGKVVGVTYGDDESPLISMNDIETKAAFLTVVSLTIRMMT